MPSPRYRSPRIQVTLTPEAMAALAAVAKLTGQGKATLASELVEAAIPAMRAAHDALMVVKDAPREAQRILARFSNEATHALAQEQLDFDDLIRENPSTKRKKRKGRAGDRPT